MGYRCYQFYNGILHPVRFVSRVLKINESRYEPWAKEVFALLRVLKINGFELHGHPLTVYTHHTVLKWATSL